MTTQNSNDLQTLLACARQVVINDQEVQDAWYLVQEALELHDITPEMFQEIFANLEGDDDNGGGGNEFHIGADFDHPLPDGKYNFKRVCVSFIKEKVFCDRARLLAAYHALQKILASATT